MVGQLFEVRAFFTTSVGETGCTFVHMADYGAGGENFTAAGLAGQLYDDLFCGKRFALNGNRVKSIRVRIIEGSNAGQVFEHLVTHIPTASGLGYPSGLGPVLRLHATGTEGEKLQRMMWPLLWCGVSLTGAGPTVPQWTVIQQDQQIGVYALLRGWPWFNQQAVRLRYVIRSPAHQQYAPINRVEVLRTLGYRRKRKIEGLAFANSVLYTPGVGTPPSFT